MSYLFTPPSPTSTPPLKTGGGKEKSHKNSSPNLEEAGRAKTTRAKNCKVASPF